MSRVFFLIDHFTLASLVAACPLNESEASGDLVLIETSLLFLCLLPVVSIYIRKAVRFLSKRGYFQPYFHSKARHLGTQL